MENNLIFYSWCRLKEEYQSLIKYVSNNKEADNDWFRLESNKEGTRWFGKCWHYHNQLKYEFDVEFDVPVTYPMTAPEIALPELDGKTAKVNKWIFEIFQLLFFLQLYSKSFMSQHFTKSVMIIECNLQWNK